jgi:hypothetical protein
MSRGAADAEVVQDLSDVPVEEVDLDVARQNLDRLARRFLGLSGSEFLTKRDGGQLDDFRSKPGFSRVDAIASLMD